MKDVTIPKKELKVKRLFMPVTPTEHKKIMQYCKKRNVKLTELIRYALQKTYGF